MLATPAIYLVYIERIIRFLEIEDWMKWYCEFVKVVYRGLD